MLLVQRHTLRSTLCAQLQCPSQDGRLQLCRTRPLAMLLTSFDPGAGRPAKRYPGPCRQMRHHRRPLSRPMTLSSCMPPEERMRPRNLLRFESLVSFSPLRRFPRARLARIRRMGSWRRGWVLLSPARVAVQWPGASMRKPSGRHTACACGGYHHPNFVHSI